MLQQNGFGKIANTLAITALRGVDGDKCHRILITNPTLDEKYFLINSTAWWMIHLSIHSIWVMPNSLYLFEEDDTIEVASLEGVSWGWGGRVYRDFFHFFVIVKDFILVFYLPPTPLFTKWWTCSSLVPSSCLASFHLPPLPSYLHSFGWLFCVVIELQPLKSKAMLIFF